MQTLPFAELEGAAGRCGIRYLPPPSFDDDLTEWSETNIPWFEEDDE